MDANTELHLTLNDIKSSENTFLTLLSKLHQELTEVALTEPDITTIATSIGDLLTMSKSLRMYFSGNMFDSDPEVKFSVSLSTRLSTHPPGILFTL